MVCQSLNPEVPNGNQNEVLMKTVEMVIQKIEEELDKLRETKQDPSLTPSVFQRGAFLSDILGLLELAAASHQQNEGNNQQNGSFNKKEAI